MKRDNAVTRRNFLTQATVAGAAATVPLNAQGSLVSHLWQGIQLAATFEVATATAGQFRQLSGSLFWLRVEDESMPVRLEQVEDLTLSGAPGDLPRQPFSITFRPADSTTRELSQDTYRVEHQVLGGFDLFLVPMGQGRLQAVFS